jgi:HNH endonuclease
VLDPAVIITRLQARSSVNPGTPLINGCHCREWHGSCDEHGYGQMWDGERVVSTHRLVWLASHGSIPDGEGVLHRCDNPPCLEEAHLFTGDHTSNMRDMSAKGRDGFTRHPELRPRGERHWTRAHPERVLRGENSGSARLTWALVHEIRRRCATEESRSSIARAFGISRRSGWFIERGEQWREEPLAGADLALDGAESTDLARTS